MTSYRHGCRCDRCRAANARARRLQRERKRAAAGNPRLTLVADTPDGTHGDTPDAAVAEDATDRGRRGDLDGRYLGPVEDAVKNDIDELSSDVPMHRTLRAMALALAREIDDMDGKGSKAALHNQLLDVVTKLRGDGDGESEGDDALIAALSQPLVPGSA